jgi:metal-responsive CopG/Arc/MetJ family transcriptional regulator
MAFTCGNGRTTPLLARRVIPWYYHCMKTAISLPDDIFTASDALAKRLGLSRSALIAAALAEFIAKHRGAKVSERLNAVYAAEESRLDAPTSRAQRKSLRHSEW